MSDGQLAYTELQRQITKHQGEWAMFSWYPKCCSTSINVILNCFPYESLICRNGNSEYGLNMVLVLMKDMQKKICKIWRIRYGLWGKWLQWKLSNESQLNHPHLHHLITRKRPYWIFYETYSINLNSSDGTDKSVTLARLSHFPS